MQPLQAQANNVLAESMQNLQNALDNLQNTVDHFSGLVANLQTLPDTVNRLELSVNRLNAAVSTSSCFSFDHELIHPRLDYEPAEIRRRDGALARGPIPRWHFAQ